MIEELLLILTSKLLKIDIQEKTPDAVIFSFWVKAKPGARIEKTWISAEGELVIQTRSKPVEGEANAAIIEVVSNQFGVSKSSVEIIRGEKSKLKHLRIKLILTANKKAEFYKQKFIEIADQEALD